jgi:hypothetical protein
MKLLPCLLALLAAGCAAAPPASLTLEAAPGYHVQNTFVIPHILEKSGTISSRMLEGQGYQVKACLVAPGEPPLPLDLVAFVVNAHTSPFDTSVFGFQPEEIHATADARVWMTIRKWVASHAKASGARMELTLVDDPRTQLPPFASLYGLSVADLDGDGLADRTVGAGVVSDIIECARMAINEKGIPSKKSHK